MSFLSLFLSKQIQFNRFELLDLVFKLKTFQNLNNGFKIIIFTFFFISINSYAEDYFWVGNSGNWSDFANHWSVSSGGSSMHSSVPGIDDNVFFDQNSFNVLSSVVLDLSIMQCKSFDCSTITSPSNIIGASSSVLEVYGDWNSSPLISNAFLGQITFASSSSSFIKSEGIPFQGQINFDGIGWKEATENKQKSGFGYGTAKIERAFTSHTGASSIQLWPLI